MAKNRDNKNRLPRPFGTTALLNEYSKATDEAKPAIRATINNFMIQQWFLSNGNICGVTYSVNDLAKFLTINPSEIQSWMMDQVLHSNLWDPNKSQDMVNSIMGQTIAWAFEDRMEVQNQVELLKRSQGGNYAPFISGEVNRALKMKLDTSLSLQSLLRLVTGGGSTTNNFFTQFNNNQAPEQESGITITEAIRIIQEEQMASHSEKKDATLEYIEAAYDLDNLDIFPEVCALDQHGVDASKEGLNLMSGELEQITGNYKGAIALADKEFEEIGKEIVEKVSKHNSRRQLEIGEDLDADDPECELYD